MKALSSQDLLSPGDYEAEREKFRQRIIELKRRRRISVGDKITLVFENRDTVQFQVQEMIRVERIFDPKKIQDELDIYNALLPGPGELSATLMIEITEQTRIKEELDGLMGIDGRHTVALETGAQRAYGIFEKGHSNEDKISAVHFIRFPLPRAFVVALKQPDPSASVVIDHPSYRVSAQVPKEMVLEWLSDLGEAV